MRKDFNSRFKLILLIGVLLAGCSEKYNHTVKVCNGSLYVEIFDVNPAGVSEHYLTDTVNFRFFVGKYDNEHENFSYECEGDSLVIFKMEFASRPRGVDRVSNVRKFSLAELKRNKIFE